MNCKIDIKGLTLGEHIVDIPIDGTFFESYENDIVSDADLNVNIKISKSVGWVKAEMDIEGFVIVPCDRCLEDLKLPVSVSAPFTVKFSSWSDDDSDGGVDDMIILDKNESDLDLSQLIYDYVCLSFPIRKVHPEGECDPKVLEKLKDIMK